MYPFDESRTWREPNVATAPRRHGRGCVVYIIIGFAFFCTSTSLHAQTDPADIDSLDVEEILFTGNDSFSDDELRSLIATDESSLGFFVWLIGQSEHRYFDFRTMLDDVEVIKKFYRNNGFFEARVAGRYERTEDNSAVQVYFDLDEGRSSYVDSIAYRRLQELPPTVQGAIARAPLLRMGQRYSAPTVQAERARVLEILANNGFPRAFSDSVTVDRKMSNNNVVVKMNFNHGRRLYFGNITEKIEGDDDLNLARQIIYERLDFEKGDIYSRELLLDGETNMNRLGVFSYVSLKPEFPAIDNPVDSLVPMTLGLRPKTRYELAPAAILNNQLRGVTAGGEVSFMMRNVFGGAQSLTTRLSLLGRIPDYADTYISSSQLLFEQPYLFSNRNSLSFSGSYSFVGERDLVTGDILQITLGVKRFFTSRLIGQVVWTYEISEFTGDPTVLLGRGLIYVDTEETINFRNSIRRLSLEDNQTDDLYYPSEGFFWRALVEEAGWFEGLGLPLPQADEEKGIRSTEYVKLEGLVKYFHDFSRNETAIFGMRLRLGSIFRYGKSMEDDLPVPINRRYFAGGATSIRGWQNRELSADPEAGETGSNALLEVSTELRWQLFPRATNALEGLGLVAFVDAGNLWTDINRMRIPEIALALGIGIRFNLPFAPLPVRVDFGIKGYNPASSQYKWFFEKDSIWDDVIRKGVILFGIGHAF